MSRRPIITMAPWVASLAAANTTLTNIVFCGSSTTAGGNSSSRAARYVEILGTKLRRRYNLTADLHTHIATSADDGDIAESGTVTRSYQGLSRQNYLLSQGATLTFSFTGKALTVMFAVGTGAGAFQVVIDGGAPTVITPSTSEADNTHTGSQTISGLSSGAHTAVLTATNSMRFCGAVAHLDHTDRGLVVYNSGIGGAISADFTPSTDPKIFQRIGALSPGLIVYMTGSNDFSTGVTPAVYKTNVQTFVTSVRAVSSAPILLVQPYRRFDVASPAYAWSLYGTAQSEVAVANENCFYVDITDYYPTSQATDNADLIFSDSIHQTNAGHAFMARLLFSALI